VTVVCGTIHQSWESYRDPLESLFDRFQPPQVCDLGGGRRPQVDLETLQRRGLDYTLLGISQVELHQAPPAYKTLCLDIASKNLALENQFDFVFSRMLAEHV